MANNRQQNHEDKDCFSEARRFYQNARENLKKAGVQYDRYMDKKFVHEACGMAYLSALKALDGYFLRQGVSENKLPTSVEGYREYMRKHLTHNGKVKEAFATVYENLHIFGYYRGGRDTAMIKQGFQKAKFIIEVLGKSSG